MRRPSRRWLAALLATGMVALASCGIPEDSKPREISREALPPELIDPASTDTSVPADTATRNFTLYLVRGDNRDGEALVSVRLKVPEPPEDGQIPLAVAQTLIDASPESLGFNGLVNRLPRAAQVRSAVVDENNVLDLDLTNLSRARSALERLAVAQLVQAFAMSSVALIVFAWGRRVVAEIWALAAAALAVCIPGLAYSGMLMTEALFYPLVTFAL